MTGRTIVTCARCRSMHRFSLGGSGAQGHWLCDRCRKEEQALRPIHHEPVARMATSDLIEELFDSTLSTGRRSALRAELNVRIPSRS